jgi:hypothetical protein
MVRRFVSLGWWTVQPQANGSQLWLNPYERDELWQIAEFRKEYGLGAAAA